MKDWKFLQVGNAKTGNYESSTQRPDSKIYQTIQEFIKTSGGDADKAFVAIKRKYPNLTDEFIEKSIDEVIRTNKAGNESIDKQEWSMFNGLRKDAEKEIGNEFATAPKAISIGDNVETLTGKKGNVVEKNGHILKIKLSDGSFEYEHEYKAKKVGNATGDEYNAEIQRLTKKAEQLRRMGQGRSAMEIEKQIEKLGKELSELGNSKTGNGTPGSIASIGPAWMHGGTVYGKMDTDESGKHHNEYVKITWLGEGKGGVANYFIDDKMQSDKFGSLDKNELKRWAESKIGNSTWSEPRKMPFQQNSLKYAYEKAKGNGLSGKRLEEEMLRIAKTLPHESSATEEEKKKDVSEWILRNGSREDFVNNLARARNAMKKKVKNSSVREYKDSEGRIAQIDFDSDGTDADMSIYEDERMTRSVDHKNFSTIRDAEQYVQSHGFRRVG